MPEPANPTGLAQKHLDLPYADLSPAQKLDLYLPEGPGPHPLILSVHGGAFLGGDKADNQLLPMLDGLRRGYAVASLNYRMSGEALFPALIQDARAAVRWLRANAGRYRLDPARFAAWGGSAGGWQVLMMGLTGGTADFFNPSLGHPDHSDQLQAVVSWFPPTNFLSMDEQLTASGLPPRPGEEHSGPRSPESLLLGRRITEIPELVRAANPAAYLHPGIPPMLLQHGTGDATVPYQQSLEFAEQARRVCGSERVQVELLEGETHGGPGFSAPANLARVFAFLDPLMQ